MDKRKKTYIKSQQKRSDNMKEFGYTQISDWIKQETKNALEEIKNKNKLRRKGEAIDLVVQSYLKEN